MDLAGAPSKGTIIERTRGTSENSNNDNLLLSPARAVHLIGARAADQRSSNQQLAVCLSRPILSSRLEGHLSRRPLDWPRGGFFHLGRRPIVRLSRLAHLSAGAFLSNDPKFQVISNLTGGFEKLSLANGARLTERASVVRFRSREIQQVIQRFGLVAATPPAAGQTQTRARDRGLASR